MEGTMDECTMILKQEQFCNQFTYWITEFLAFKGLKNEQKYKTTSMVGEMVLFQVRGAFKFSLLTVQSKKEQSERGKEILINMNVWMAIGTRQLNLSQLKR